MYSVQLTKAFRKDVERCKKRGYEMPLLSKAIHLLEENGCLPASYKPHKLSGIYEGSWEAHIKGDWLLLWQQNDTELILLFTGTGTHSDVF